MSDPVFQGDFSLWADTFISVRLLAFDPLKREREREREEKKKKRTVKAWSLPLLCFQLLLILLFKKDAQKLLPNPALCMLFWGARSQRLWGVLWMALC